MIAVSGWVAAFAAASWALWWRSALSERMELVARACHELRGPITGARLGVELLAREGVLRAEALSAIQLELASAGLALEDLRLAPAGRRGPWRVETVDVTALMTESVEAFRPQALARGVELDLRWRGEPGVLSGDRLRLAQATGNLIANAIEHGEGRVELRGGMDDAGLEISVADAGQGPHTPLSDLVRGPRGARRDGRGRGLMIVAEIAQRHGGRLVADGSRMTLELPCGDGPKRPPADNGSRRSMTQRR